IVHQVMTDPTNRRITVVDEQEEKKKKRAAKSGVKKGTSKKGDDSIIGTVCPKCGKGIIIKGRTAYGCSDYKNCDYRVKFG
ncbi:MAG: DNA topoisomerase III, partial [Prevotella sp.]|nr:DNA topoisomerase III [Prevotella sp.]